jgi:gas vesicle protein
MIKKESEIGFAIGFVTGVILGFGIAFVSAPQSGLKTRDYIKDKASDASGKFKEITGDRKKIYTKTWKETKRYPRVRVTEDDY